MFTRTFRKPALAYSALLTAGVLYACFAFTLNSLSGWAERDLDAYPFKQEDWLRYFLPSKFEQSMQQRILITGPSTVRENLLYERFEAAYPEHLVIQGGLSLGALDDVTASLNYISDVYGDQALPQLLVLGISPRFIGNLPADRPLKEGINRYSPYLSALQGDSGIELSAKGPLDALVSRANFQIRKQPERYRTTLLAIANHWIAGTPSTRGPDGKTSLQRGLDRFFKRPQVRQYLVNTQYQRALDYEFSELLAWLISPYKYRLDAPVNVDGLIEWMDATDSWWQDVHAWDPQATRQSTLAALERLDSIIKAHGIAPVIINMPERDISRERYDRENYQAYLNIVSEGLGGAPVLDLQTFLKSGEFHDLEHSKFQGSERLTGEIIRNMKRMY